MELTLCPNRNFRLKLLTEETTDATNSIEYLSHKRAWCEDKLVVARLLSIVSPAGHSLVAWAAACGQAEIVKVLMDHGATAGPGDETKAISASILQVYIPCYGGELSGLNLFAVRNERGAL